MGKRSPSKGKDKAARAVRGPGRIPPRLALWFTGMGLGAVWGSIMFGIFALTGQSSSLGTWLYITITTAIIGGLVATIFGAGQARRRGERISPRMPFGRRGRDR